MQSVCNTCHILISLAKAYLFYPPCPLRCSLTCVQQNNGAAASQKRSYCHVVYLRCKICCAQNTNLLQHIWTRGFAAFFVLCFSYLVIHFPFVMPIKCFLASEGVNRQHTKRRISKGKIMSISSILTFSDTRPSSFSEASLVAFESLSGSTLLSEQN